MESVFTSFDGTKIFYRYSGELESKRVFVIVHGLLEHSGRYIDMIEEISSWGLPVFVPDLRGHGNSEGPRGDIESFSNYLLDLKTFYDILLTSGYREFYLLGHSMGGLIVTRFIQEYQEFIKQTKTVILSSPFFGWKDVSPSRLSLIKFLSFIMPTLYLTNVVNPDYLSHSREVADRYRNDPLINNRITLRFVVEIDKNMKILREKLNELFPPVLLLASGEDYLVDTESARDIFNKINSPLKRCYIFPDSYHEIFNDNAKKTAYKLIREWIEKTKVE
ncbi:MAG: lysophospholipase [bacterium]|nr:lysophospholipase [bacterium]